jgi:hypothetical protein
MSKTKDQRCVDQALDIWNEISDDPYIAVAITRVLISSCLASCHPDDRQKISDVFFSQPAFEEETLH